jgi:hypothetical protein
MSRHYGSEHVKAGFYVNLDSWEVRTVSGRDGATLDGDAAVRYMRIPALALLLFAPIMGAAFAIFLPFIGIAMVAQYLVSRAWSAMRRVSHGTVDTLGPSWQPSAAHLTGSRDEKKKDASADEARKAEAALETLDREITEAKRETTPKA